MKPVIKSAIFLLLTYFISQVHANAQNDPRWRWAQTGTNATVDISVSDTLGNTIVFGVFTTSEFSIGNVRTTGIVGAPSDNLYLAKYTSTGSLMWLKSIAGTVANTILKPVKVMTNSRGDIVILGTAMNTPELRIDNTTVKFTNENEQMFIAKFHKSGKILWARIVQVRGGEIPSVSGKDLFVNDAGEVFVTGHFIADTALFNLKLLPGHSTDPVFFLAKYSALGLVDWATACDYDKGGDNGSVSGHKVAVSNANEVTVAGEVSGYRMFFLGTDTLYTIGGTDVFIAQFTPDGMIKWTRQIKGILDERLEQLMIDDAQNILVAGLYNSDMVQVYDRVIPNTSNGYDLFVTQIKPDGATSWAQNIDIKLQTMDIPGSTAILHVDEVSDVYVATLFQGAEVLSNTLLIPNLQPGTPDLLFVKLEGTSGIPVWSRSVAAIGENWLNSVTYDRFSSVYFTTSFTISDYAIIDASEVKDTIGFGGNFIAKINRFGNVGYVKPVLNKDSNSSVNINALSVDYYGNLYVSGAFQGTNNSLDDLPLTTVTGGIYTAKYAYVTNLSGQVTEPDGTPVTGGYVTVYGFTWFQRSPISDSVTIGADGYYIFNKIPFGRYIFYAKPDKRTYLNSTPTYYPGEGHWADASKITISSTAPVTGIDIIINMPDGPSGTGSLGGNIFETDTITSVFKSTSSVLKAPAKEVSVVLVNRRKGTGGDVVAVVYTDDFGDFIISGIADGDYTLIADIPGLPHASYYDITIAGGQFIGNL
ncbi:MAG TPA: carboxypeptidase-like regulatory domain-containing protein, partial [Bacteroidales bacterium]|nr:carboxypeptidase-like regulatory domain-containing protein [Bacteroidales bacterium]